MKNYGLKKGDLITLLAPNHLDVCIVYYAALYLGISFAALDRNATMDGLRKIFECDKPRLMFCQSAKVLDIQLALKNAKQVADIIIFDDITNENLMNCQNFSAFTKKYGGDIFSFDSFRSRFTTFPTPTRMILIIAPLMWVSAMVHFNMSPILRYTRLQSSEPSTIQHIRHMFKIYKPTFLATSTTMLSNLIQQEGYGAMCDLSSLELVIFGGSGISERLLADLKRAMPKTELFEAYGFTEASTYFVFEVGSSPTGSCGKPAGYLQYRLIDIETQEDITIPNKAGELWVKGPGMSKGYYNDPEATKEALTEDGWFKTGDLLYRDENLNFYYVDRLKLLIKYKTYLISPTEVENVIRLHPGVYDVAVTAVPDYECLNLPVACIVRRPGHNVSAQDIKDFVKEKLEDWKQLTGGIIFLNDLPMTATTKLDRRRIKEIVLKETRE